MSRGCLSITYLVMLSLSVLNASGQPWQFGQEQHLNVLRDQQGFPIPQGCINSNLSSVAATPTGNKSPGFFAVNPTGGCSQQGSYSTTPGMHSNNDGISPANLTLPVSAFMEREMQRQNNAPSAAFVVPASSHELQGAMNSIVEELLQHTRQFLDHNTFKQFFCIGADGRGNMLRAKEFFDLAKERSVDFNSWVNRNENGNASRLLDRLRACNQNLREMQQRLGREFPTVFYHMIGEPQPLPEFG